MGTGVTILQPRLFSLYAVPMLQAWYPDSAAANAELARLCLQREAAGDAYRNQTARDTQQHIFESRFDLHEASEPCVRALFAFMHRTLLDLVAQLGGYSAQQVSALETGLHSWFHITRRGGFQSMHSHPNASWSAIYCVDPGDGEGDSGAVRFFDPRIGGEAYRDPANANLAIPYRHGEWMLHHKAGQLLIFPSYLQHEVFPYTGSRPRIVVALNFWCRWR